MAKLSTAFIFLTTLSLFSLGATRRYDSPLNQQEPHLKLLLSKVPYVSLQEICQDRVIMHFDLWWESWTMKFLQKNNDYSGTNINNMLLTGVEGRIKEVREFLDKLEAHRAKLSVFPPLHMDAKVTSLVNSVNSIIDIDVPNPYAKSDFQVELQSKHGFYLPEFLDGIVKKPLTAMLISQVGTAFKADYDLLEKPEGQFMKPTIDALVPALRKTLKSIMAVYSKPKGTTYRGLNPEQKRLLQHFFDTFVYLWTPEELQSEILTNLVGHDRPATDIANPFFTHQVFQYLKKNPTSYRDYINRDEFITLPAPETDLEKIHDAAKEMHFSWAFLGEFDANPADMQLGKSKFAKHNQGSEVIERRKEAKLRLMMYKVYLFARTDGLIPFEASPTNQEILKILFTWVRDTDVFDDVPAEESRPEKQSPELEALGDINQHPDLEKLPKHKHAQLFKPSKFKRYYVPLLTYLCSKIVGCSLLDEVNKSAIVGKFEKFGNFEELKAKKLVSKLIPKDVLEALIEAHQDNELDRLEAQLDKLADDIPAVNLVSDELEDLEEEDDDAVIKTPKKVDFDTGSQETKNLPVNIPEFQPITPEKLSPVVFKVDKKRKPAKLLAAIKGPQEAAFQPLVDKFLPPTGEVTDQTKQFVTKMIEKSESVEDKDKKAIMRTLLIRGILTLYKNNAKKLAEEGLEPTVNPANELARLVNNKLVAKIRSSFSWTATAGLRNFLFRTMNSEMGINYRAMSPVEAELYHNDIIFFIYLADEDKVERIKQEKPLRPKSELQRIGQQVKEARFAVYKYLVPKAWETKKDDKSLQAALIEPLMNSPLLMERLSAYEFFVPLLDFFRYYEEIAPTAAGEYADYGLIYMNFYNFVNSLRAELFFSVGDTHEYVLQSLEDCLLFTESVQEMTAEHSRTVCKLSHRKYAEMYYLYKLYLVAMDKPTKVNLNPYKDRSFDTHVRLFINFAQENTRYRHALDTACKRQPTAPICVVWSVYNQLLVYLHDPQLLNSFADEVFRNMDWKNPATKFHALGALEATFFNIEKGNVKDYSKMLGLIERLADEGRDLLSFDQSDVPALAAYLKRTYRKLVLTVPETRVAEAVKVILGSPANDDLSKDLFASYLVFGDVVYLDYLKLFLLVAQTDDEFTRIAQMIVRAKGGRALIRMNSASKHSEFSSFIVDIGSRDTPLSGRYEAIREWIKVKYEENHRTCVNLIKDKILGATIGLAEEWDPFNEMSEETQRESEIAVKREDSNFDKLVAEVKEQKSPKKETIVVEQLITIERQVSRKESQLLEDFEIEDQDVVEVHYESEFNDGLSETNSNLEDSSKATFIVNDKRVQADKGLDLTGNLAAMLKKAQNNAMIINAKVGPMKVTSSDVSNERANQILGQFMQQAGGKKLEQKLLLKKNGSQNKDLI